MSYPNSLPVARQVNESPTELSTLAEPAVSRQAAPPVSQKDTSTSPTGEKRQFDVLEIEFLASKVYAHIKEKLMIEKERHGRPGYLW